MIEPSYAHEFVSRERSVRAVLVCLWLVFSLSAIAEPPLGRDAWRETDGLMVGRNFCREDARLWLPRIDARGDGTGITGMELPILPYMHGLAGCAGLNEVMVGRLLTIASTLLAAWSVWCLAASFLEAWWALLALGLFLFSPLIVHYGHALQPDVPAVALALWGLSCLERALKTGAPRWRIGAACGLGLGMLVKLPVIIFGLPAAAMLVSAHGWREVFRPRWLLLGCAAVCPAIAWYAYARGLQERYGYAHFRLGTSMAEVVAAATSASFYERLVGHAIDFYLMPPLAIAALLGVLWYFRTTPAWLLATGVATGVYFVLSADAGVHHYYYGIVAVPFFALAAASTLSRAVPQRLARHWLVLGVLALAVIHGIARSRAWRPKSSASDFVAGLRACLDQTLPAGERVTLYARNDPTLFWFIDRKGWLAEPGDAPHGSAIIDKRRFDSISYAQSVARLTAGGYALRCENERAAVFDDGVRADALGPSPSIIR